MALFNAMDISEIEAAITAAEARSSGELVVAILPRSGTYEKTCGLACLAVTVAVTIAFHFSSFAPSSLQLVIIQALLFYLAWAAFQWAPLLRCLLTTRQRQGACRKRAHQLFSRLGVYKTRDRSGVLLLISELEHQVFILGDEGISSCLEKEGWQQGLDKLIEGIDHNLARESLLKIIHSLGDIFAERFPRRVDDTNELADRVVQSSED